MLKTVATNLRATAPSPSEGEGWGEGDRRVFTCAMLNERKLLVLLAATLALLAAACAGGDAVEPTPQPAARAVEPSPSPVPDTPTPSATPEAEPTQTPIPTAPPVPTATATPAGPAGYDSNAAMYEIFPAFSIVRPDLEDTLDEVVEQNDQSLAPFLVEVLRFMPSRRSAELIGQALRDLTGQPFATEDWESWMDWAGRNADRIEPPSEYVAWKAKTYSAIDPRMGIFIRPASEFSRINPTEIVWGGVLTDGIPPLASPRALSPHEADYMEPDDRVFGVSINGEKKAYPLRVVNAHEMVNDTVGGEPISLMW